MHNSDFRSTNGLCLVDTDWFKGFNIPLPQVIETIQERFGFEVMEVDILQEARSLVGTGEFLRRTLVAHAPEQMDCSSMIVHLYSLIGVEVPRLAYQQFRFGVPMDVADAQPGDLIFTSGRYGYHLTDYSKAVGHVGLLTGEGTVIHANNQDADPPLPAVDEMSIETFMQGRKFRGARRILPPKEQRLVLTVNPKMREFAWSFELMCLFSTTQSW